MFGATATRTAAIFLSTSGNSSLPPPVPATVTTSKLKLCQPAVSSLSTASSHNCAQSSCGWPRLVRAQMKSCTRSRLPIVPFGNLTFTHAIRRKSCRRGLTSCTTTHEESATLNQGSCARYHVVHQDGWSTNPLARKRSSWNNSWTERGFGAQYTASRPLPDQDASSVSRMAKKRKFDQDLYVRVAKNNSNLYTCPGCAVTCTNFKKLYNHYYFQSVKQDSRHPGLLTEDKGNLASQAQAVPSSDSTSRQPTCNRAAEEQSESWQGNTPEHANLKAKRSSNADSLPSHCKVDALSAAQTNPLERSGCPVSLHQLPKECRCSVLIHGHLQIKVPLEKLQAAADVESCCTGAEAWLHRETIISIRSKALLDLHPDKNMSQDQTECNDLFNKFQERLDKLLHTTAETQSYFWEHLVRESFAAASYLSYCAGWQQCHSRQVMRQSKAKMTT